MVLAPRRSRKIQYAPKKVFHSIRLGFTMWFVSVLFVVASLYQEMADILGNHCTGCLDCSGGKEQHGWLDINVLLEAII